jgi:ligand-binding SRPBCC domain-containing protein
MPIYKLERKQFINAPIQDIWRFFSNPVNLKAITPAYMNFVITSGDLPEEIQAGQVITYKVSPILNIPLNWETAIAEAVQHKYFVDEQKKGPYKLWRHKHIFEEKDGGVLMTDQVSYELPLGMLGVLAHSLLVKKQLREIFDFRYSKIENLFKKS